MKPRIKFIFFIIYLFFPIQHCLAQDLASEYRPKNKTERIIIAKIRAVPEVKDFYKYVKSGKPDFIIDPPGTTDKNCYAMQIGTDYGDVFRTNFWLLINPKTLQVYYEDFDDEGMETITLQQWRYWRRRPEFHKSHKWVRGKLVVVETEKKLK